MAFIQIYNQTYAQLVFFMFLKATLYNYLAWKSWWSHWTVYWIVIRKMVPLSFPLCAPKPVLGATTIPSCKKYTNNYGSSAKKTLAWYSHYTSIVFRLFSANWSHGTACEHFTFKVILRVISRCLHFMRQSQVTFNDLVRFRH